MASINSRTHKDGSTTHRVLWREGKKQRSLSFVDIDSAERFRVNIDRHGPAEALSILNVVDTSSEPTLSQWLTEHVDGLTGVQEGTRKRYRGYIVRDLDGLGHLPLSAVTPAAVGAWVQRMEDAEVAGKTIQNKHAFLSGGLKSAVMAGRIDSNPCAGLRLPRTIRDEMVMLTPGEWKKIHAAISNPVLADLAEWLVSTGMRFGEATALTDAAIDMGEGTCRITQAWKESGTYGQVLGVPKSRRSVRTINLPENAVAIAKRRAGGEWIFRNGRGNPIRRQDFHNRAWSRASRVLLAGGGVGRKPRVHDLRHTCASWMIGAGIPIVVVSRHLGHEDITTTVNTYSHVDRASGAAAAEAIGKLMA